MPIDDVNGFVELLLLLAMGRSVFPTNGLRDVFESGAFESSPSISVTAVC
jgi:hypothetical protein